MADFATGMLLLSNKTTISMLSNAPTHTHHKTKDEMSGKGEVKSEKATQK